MEEVKSGIVVDVVVKSADVTAGVGRVVMNDELGETVVVNAEEAAVRVVDGASIVDVAADTVSVGVVGVVGTRVVADIAEDGDNESVAVVVVVVGETAVVDNVVVGARVVTDVEAVGPAIGEGIEDTTVVADVAVGVAVTDVAEVNAAALVVLVAIAAVEDAAEAGTAVVNVAVVDITVLEAEEVGTPLVVNAEVVAAGVDVVIVGAAPVVDCAVVSIADAVDTVVAGAAVGVVSVDEAVVVDSTEAVVDAEVVGEAADVVIVGAAVVVDAVVAGAAVDVVGGGIVEEGAVGVGAMVVAGGAVAGGTDPQLEASTEARTSLAPHTTLLLMTKLPKRPLRTLVAMNCMISLMSSLKLVSRVDVLDVDFRRRTYTTSTLPFLESRAEESGLIWDFTVGLVS